MSVAHDLIIDQLASTPDAQQHLATWYTQGHSDGLGDRLLMFDNTSAPSWEILRFKPALARDPRFEAALRARMEQLASFQHPAFPLVRPLKGLGHEDGLAVVSTYAPGVRLAEAMKRPRSAAFAVRLLRQLAPALTALQQHGPGIFHGVLDADRIVVTANGRLTIREQMVGAALGSLELSAARLWSDFHLLASPIAAGTPTLDSRSDVVQLGLIVLSLMAGHRIGPDEYPDKVEGLLDEIAERNGRQALVFFQALRYWIERALQIDDYMFESARDASDALAELRDDSDQNDDFPASIAAMLPDGPGGPGSNIDGAAALDESRTWPQTWPRPRLVTTNRVEAAGGASAPAVMETIDVSAAIPIAPAASAAVAVSEERLQPAPTDVKPPRRRFGRAMYWAAAVAVVAIAEAVFIGRMLYPGASVAPPPPAPVVAAEPPPVQLLPTGVAALIDTKGPEIPTAPESRGTTLKVSAKNGGFRITSPIEVHVLDNERVLGSSADGPIVAPAGRHEFDFVNSAIGYRVRRIVEVKAGQIASLSVTVPNGTLNINAVPWAAVWIDGTSFGDTPLGNLSIAPGEHEIVFRHPQLGERREKTLVRADAATRVTVNLQK